MKMTNKCLWLSKIVSRRQLLFSTFGLFAVVLVAVLSAAKPNRERIQDTGSKPLEIRLQFQDSPGYQAESVQPLKRAIVFAKRRNSSVGALFGAYVFLSNVPGENCDLSKHALAGDSDFAFLAMISEKFEKKIGPETTSIHHVLFGGADPTPYVFVATMSSRDRLKEILGDVPHRVKAAMPIGWGSGGSVTSIPKGKENQAPVEVRWEESAFGWTFLLQHSSVKKGWRDIRPNSSTYLVLSRSDGAPNLKLQHREKKLSVSANVPLTVCGILPEGSELPFGPNQ